MDFNEADGLLLKIQRFKSDISLLTYNDKYVEAIADTIAKSMDVFAAMLMKFYELGKKK